MSVDENLVVEAERLLRHYSTPARALVIANQHGPLEARLAGAVVAFATHANTVVVHSEASMPEDQLKAIEDDATERIEALAGVLEQAIEILAARCVGVDELINAAEIAIADGRAEFNIDVPDSISGGCASCQTDEVVSSGDATAHADGRAARDHQ